MRLPLKTNLLYLSVFFCVSANSVFAQRDVFPPLESDSLSLRRSQMLRLVEPLYRQPTKTELNAVKIPDSVEEKYKSFLRLSDTGITKLIKDRGCADNQKVVSATEDCLKYSMPGGGSSFSFRTENYRIARLADISFIDNSFQSAGALQQSIFVNIGNVPIENATVDSAGMKFLAEFTPETEFRKNREVEKKFLKGVLHNGFLYRRGLFVQENTTFAVRSIAFKGFLPRTAAGLVYNELEFDKRRDIMVVFRVVDKDEEGNLTILWRILRESKSPELKRSKHK